MQKLNGIIFLFSGLFIMMSCAIKPPSARMIEHIDTTFTDVRNDPYFWLRERENPEVIRYLEAENKYTKTQMAHTEKFQTTLFDEMVSRIKESDTSVPYRSGPYFYYSRTEEGQQYPIRCRKKESLDAEEEILLDENLLAKEYKYFNVGVFRISPDHNLLAYSVDTSGSESYTVFVKDLYSNKLLVDQIEGVYYGLAWANDNRTLLYNIIDESTRPFKVFRHSLGTKSNEDVLVYHEQDERFFLDIRRSKSGEYLFLEMQSQITTEVKYLNANRPEGEFKTVSPRVNGVEYSVLHNKKDFYIRTNENAQNFKLMQAPIKRLAKHNWQQLIPAQAEVTLDKIEIFENHLAVFFLENGLKGVQIHNLNTKENYLIEFEEDLYDVAPSDNKEFKTNHLRFHYASMITPGTIFDYNMDTYARELKKQKEVPGYDPSNYASERIFATAADGEEIPISLIYKKGLKKNGTNPLYLYGYGSYGIIIEPDFSSNRFSLIDRGFIYAIAHVRGSSTMGRQWYEDGKLLKKKNTFTDFIACADYLIKEKYTNSQKLAMVGGSAGGLLMGTVVNMRPDLFKAVVAQVPFVDVINTMLDASIPLTVIEYEEWGNPSVEEYYHYMKSYSPYDNVQVIDYPHILITAGLNDPRVQYWEPAKWTAKLRALKTDDNMLLLKTNMGAGHGGASGRYDYLKEIALEYAFILDRIGINK